MIKEVPVQVAVVQPLVQERIKEVEVVVEKPIAVDRIQPVEVAREVIKEVVSEVEVPKEVQVEVLREKTPSKVERVEVVKPVEVIKHVPKEVKVHTERPVVETIDVVREVPVTVKEPAPFKVPVVKVVQLEAESGQPPGIYQRTAGGYKVWNHDGDDIDHGIFRGHFDWVWSKEARATQRRMDELGLIWGATGKSALVPPPLATGWGRWTESHRRSIYGPVGDARGQRHLPASALDPGMPAYTSGVTPTGIVPRYNKVLGPHAFPLRPAPAAPPVPLPGALATREYIDARAGGYALTPVENVDRMMLAVNRT